MKRILPITVLLIILVFILISCVNKEAPLDEMFRWPKSGYADFDSAHLHINRVFYDSSPLEEKKAAFIILDSIGRKIEDPLVRDIVKHWKLRLMIKMKFDAAVKDSIVKYLETFDAVRRPYPYYKTLSVAGTVQEDNALGFMQLNTALDWFKDQGDLISIGECYNNIGLILLNSNYNKEKIKEYFSKADAVFREADAEVYRLKNLLNVAFSSGNDSIKEAYHRMALNNSVLKEDVFFYQRLLLNLYLFTDSVKYIDENIDRLKDYPYLHNDLAMNYAFKGEALLKDNRIDESMNYLRKAKNKIDTFAPAEYHVEIFRVLSDVYKAKEKYDSALFYRDKRDFWQEKVESENAKARLYNADTAYKIANIENEWKLQSQKVKFITWIVSVTVGIVIIMTGIAIYRHIKKKERDANMIKEKLSQSRSALAANTIILSEKNKILNEVKNEVGQLNEKGKISEEVASDLTKNLKLHLSNESERESFMAIYDKLNINFSRHLKEDYPTLTESQIRLAAYIAIGMSNAHIAQMLNIGRDSLKVIRSRLRKKLGLQTNESLEDFLRNYSCGNKDEQ